MPETKNISAFSKREIEAGVQDKLINVVVVDDEVTTLYVVK